MSTRQLTVLVRDFNRMRRARAKRLFEGAAPIAANEKEIPMPIAHNSYDSASRVYTVQFREGGPIYQYHDVEPEKANAIDSAAADDVGKTIQATLVTGKPYEFTKVIPDPEAPAGEGA